MFDFDYNGGYTNEQLQYLDRQRRRQGRQWMQTGVIPGGLEEQRLRGIEAPAPPQIRPIYANPQSSGMGPVAPEYTRAEQEAQAANQIFDGSGRRIPEYVFGAKERAEHLASPDDWDDYNRAAAAKGEEGGIFIQVGDEKSSSNGPAYFYPRQRNPQYDIARQRQQEELAAMERARQKPFNHGDTQAKLVQSLGAQLASMQEGDPRWQEVSAMYSRAARGAMESSGLAESGSSVPPWVRLIAQGFANAAMNNGQAAPQAPATPAPMRQRPTLDQLRGDGGQAPPQQRQPPQAASGQPIEDGEEVIVRQGNSAIVRSADGKFYGIASNGTRRELTEAEVQQVLARYGSGPR